MKKIRLVALLSMFCTIVTCLSICFKSKDGKQTFAVETPDVTFTNIAGGWNNLSSSGYYHTVLAYDKQLGDAKNDTNQANENYQIGSAMTIDGVAVKDIPNAIVNYAHGNNYLAFVIPQTYLNNVATKSGYVHFHIDSGCEFMNRILPELNLYLTKNGDLLEWKTFEFVRVNPYWNNIEVGTAHPSLTLSENRVPTEGYCALLEYSMNLRADGAVVSKNMATEAYEIGKNILISGQRLCDMPSAIVDASLGSKYIYVYFKQSEVEALTNERITLEVLNHTQFGDVYLPYTKLIFTKALGNASGWDIYSEPTRTENTFVGLSWTGHAYTPYESFEQGLLLRFANKISNNPYENGSNGYLAFTNRNIAKSPVGQNIRFNGVKLSDIEGAEVRYYYDIYLFIHVPNMNTVPTEKDKNVISISANTACLDSIFPFMSFALKKGESVWTTNSDLYQTYATPTLKSMNSVDYNGISFVSQMNTDFFDSLYAQNATFGTYIIDENSYLNSGYSSIKEYVTNVAPSSKTYKDVVNTYKDAINGANKYVDGYVSFSGSLVDIQVKNYGRRFIGTGYYKLNNEITIFNEHATGCDFFTLAVAAAKAGTLPNATRYLQYGAILNETDKTYELIPDTTYSSGYSFSYLKNGYYSLTPSKEISVLHVNGVSQRVSLAANITKVISFYNDKIHFVDNADTLFGIGEPAKELWDDNNTSAYATADNLADLEGAFGCQAQRVWMDLSKLLVANVDDNNVTYANLINYDGRIILKQEAVNEVHEVIAKHRQNGVQEIILHVGGWAYKWTDPLYRYADGTYASHRTVNYDNNPTMAFVIPDRKMSSPLEADDALFSSFIDTQRELYTVLAKEFTDADCFEALNELDVGGSIDYAMDYIIGGPKPDVNRIAKWGMEYSKAMTDGVLAARTGQRIMAPASGCVDAKSGSTYRIFNSKNYMDTCYSYIQSKGGLPKDYFQAYNMHPYVLLSKDTSGEDSNYLYANYPKYSGLKYKPDNTDYDTDWNNYMEALRTIMSNYNDSGFTPFYVTEFGSCDFGLDGKNSSNKIDDSHWNKVPTEVFAEVYSKITAIVKTKSYFHTFLYFRMFDYEPNSLDFTGTGESNNGVIDELYKNSMYLKKTGQFVYQLLNNGSTDYSTVNAAITRVIQRGTYNG